MNAHQTTLNKSSPSKADLVSTDAIGSTKNTDLQRAKELVELHSEVKSRHANGEVDDALQQARAQVYEVLRQLS